MKKLELVEKAYLKVKQTIDSCESKLHFVTAGKMIDNFEKQFGISYMSKTLNLLLFNQEILFEFNLKKGGQNGKIEFDSEDVPSIEKRFKKNSQNSTKGEKRENEKKRQMIKRHMISVHFRMNSIG